MSAKGETITGATLDRIIWQRESSIIGRFSMPDDDSFGFSDDFTALGNCSGPEVGLSYTLREGVWKDNTYKGKVTRQFHFGSAIVERPRDVMGINIFLQKRFDGIGPAKARKITDEYGSDTIDILRDDPARAGKDFPFLAGGLAEKISSDLKAMADEEKVIIELLQMFAGIKGLPKNLPYRLFDDHKADAPAWIRADPYRLTKFRGVGFLLADQVAMGPVKIPVDSILRKKSATEYALREFQRSTGSVWILRDDLSIKIMGLIGINADAGISALIDDGDLVSEYDGWITFRKDHENEFLISDTIKNLLANDMTDLDYELQRLCKKFVMHTACLGIGCEACGFAGEVEFDEELGDI